MYKDIVLSIIVAYLFGSIPFGLVLSNILGKGDLRKSGSKNIGATNVFRTQGKLLGIIAFILDAVKGMVPIIIFSSEQYNQSFLLAAAVMGHIFPVWLKFKGGKGVATFIGALSVLSPKVAIFSALSWGVTLKATKISSVSSIMACFSSVIFFAVICKTKTEFLVYDFLSVFITVAIIIAKHKDNIKRIFSGKETAIFK